MFGKEVLDFNIFACALALVFFERENEFRREIEGAVRQSQDSDGDFGKGGGRGDGTKLESVFPKSSFII